MASKSKKTTAAAPATNELLKLIVQATLQGSFLYHKPDAVASLVSEGQVEQNPGMNDGQGGLATRATQKGIDAVNAPAQSGTPWGQPNGTTSTETVSAGDVGTVSAEQLAGDEANAEQAGNGGGADFVIDDSIPVPAASGRGRGRGPGVSVYPFDKLTKVGQSFFVPKAAKNLASTVSGANKRFSEVINGADGKPTMRKDRKGNDVPATRQLRQFIVRSVTENGVKGSRIWRVEPTNDAQSAA